MASSQTISKAFHRAVLIAFVLQVLVSLGLFLATQKLVEKHEHMQLASEIIAAERFEIQSAFLMSSLIEVDLAAAEPDIADINAWRARLVADLAALERTQAALHAVREAHIGDAWFPVAAEEAAFARTDELDATIERFHDWFAAIATSQPAALPALFAPEARPEGDHSAIAAFIDGSAAFLSGLISRTSEQARQLEAMIAAGHMLTVLLCGLMIIAGVRPLARRLHAALGREETYRQRLRDQATTDPLTGVGNRQALQEYVERRTGAERGFAFCTVDLNKFKPVNDEFGHDAGDAVLLEIAGRLTSAAGVEGLVVRLGGDEFGVLMEDVADADAARRLGESMVGVFAAPIRYQSYAFDVGASIGVALSCDVAGDAHAVVSASDEAMYVAKARRRGADFEVYAPRTEAEHAA